MKMWLVAGETVISAEEVKALHAQYHTHHNSQLVLLAESFGEEMGLAWFGSVGVPFVRGVNGVET